MAHTVTLKPLGSAGQKTFSTASSSGVNGLVDGQENGKVMLPAETVTHRAESNRRVNHQRQPALENQIVEESPAERRAIPVQVRIQEDRRTAIIATSNERTEQRTEIRQSVASLRQVDDSLTSGPAANSEDIPVAVDGNLLSPRANILAVDLANRCDSEFDQSNHPEFYQLGDYDLDQSGDAESESTRNDVQKIKSASVIKIGGLFGHPIKDTSNVVQQCVATEIEPPAPLLRAVPTLSPGSLITATVPSTQHEIPAFNPIPFIGDNPLRRQSENRRFGLLRSGNLEMSETMIESELFTGQADLHTPPSKATSNILLRSLSLIQHSIQLAIGILISWWGLVLLGLTLVDYFRFDRSFFNLSLPQPHRYLRNPLTTGILFGFLGLSLMLFSTTLFVVAIMFVGFCTLYFVYLREPALAKRLGEPFRCYKASVRLWFPRMRPWENKQSNTQM